nr:immunoglobulin heavy chain junction region [Mus musculus]
YCARRTHYYGSSLDY